MSNRFEIPRRTALHRLALIGGGAVALTTTMLAERAAAASKASQDAVGYQNSPQGARSCENCRQFEAPASCKVVAGTISPGGWCKIWVKKPA